MLGRFDSVFLFCSKQPAQKCLEAYHEFQRRFESLYSSGRMWIWFIAFFLFFSFFLALLRSSVKCVSAESVFLCVFVLKFPVPWNLIVYVRGDLNCSNYFSRLSLFLSFSLFLCVCVFVYSLCVHLTLTLTFSLPSFLFSRSRLFLYFYIF